MPDEPPVTKRTAPVAEIGAMWTAIVGDTRYEYKTRSGARKRIAEEIDHWIKWARNYDHAELDALLNLKGKVLAATGDEDWYFEIAGLPAHAGLRKA